MATVYLIDDDLDGSEVVAQFLEQAGHTVCQATDAHHALSSIPVILPDVIILDLRMPHMDGFTFLRQLREDRLAAAIPAVLLTGVSDPDLCWRAAQHGIDRIFLKGDYDLLELLACVEALAVTSDIPPATLQHLICPDLKGAEPVA
jgi:DNA-binding response OmpR family regulator